MNEQALLEILQTNYGMKNIDERINVGVLKVDISDTDEFVN